ncbi:hypothetical protein CLG96_05470 [Sphingomonas oleivorans]|uniref:Uncharacterized protein n=1 Tax=Sphingomonas oleivorans TaxID=1735121 RepID=A0A2T5FZ97_9SPHN|nr:hypothetical protein CLG96_05470 [Sphingomonas oleivorans]
MDIAYLEKRLAASLVAMRDAADPCAQIAHRGMVHGYRSLLAEHAAALRRSPFGAEPEPAQQGDDISSTSAGLARAVDEWADAVGAGAGPSPYLMQALSLLAAAFERAGIETVRMPDLLATLSRLPSRCEDRSPLDRVWNGAGSPAAEDRRRLLAESLREIRLRFQQ